MRRASCTIKLSTTEDTKDTEGKPYLLGFDLRVLRVLCGGEFRRSRDGRAGVFAVVAVVLYVFTLSAQVPAAPTPDELGRAPKLDVQLFLAPGNRIRFEFPKKDWQLVPGGAVAIVSLVQRAGQAAVVVEHSKLNTALAPEDITDLFAQIEADNVKEQQPGAADVQAKLIAVDRRRLVITTYSRRGVAGPERVRQYSIPVGSDLYRLTCSAATPQFARYEPVFAHVAATFATGAN